MLYSVHQMLAAFTKTPMLEIDEGEAENLANAVSRVTELYEIPLMDERSMALMMLGKSLVEVYGTRIATAIIEARKRRPPTPTKPATNPQPITSIDSFAPGVTINAQT